jgi:hypothetical protein
MVVCSGRCFGGTMLGLGACMGLRTLGRVNLGKIWVPKNQQIKRFFKTVEKIDHIQYAVPNDTGLCFKSISNRPLKLTDCY